MKKETVKKIINEINEDGEYWIILTDIPRGRGINGVDYLDFASCYLNNRDGDEVYCHIVSFEEECVRINVTYRHHYSGISTSVEYLPYECIKSVISQRDKEYDYHSLGLL